MKPQRSNVLTLPTTVVMRVMPMRPVTTLERAWTKYLGATVLPRKVWLLTAVLPVIWAYLQLLMRSSVKFWHRVKVLVVALR